MSEGVYVPGRFYPRKSYHVGFISEGACIRGGLYPRGFISERGYIRSGLYPKGGKSEGAFIRVGLQTVFHSRCILLYTTVTFFAATVHKNLAVYLN